MAKAPPTTVSASSISESTKWALPLALALIGSITIAVYWPVLQNGFIDFDDDVYVTSNAMVQQGLTFKSFIWSFSTFHAANWHPLTWLSHMLDMELFRLNPMGHHATSLLLHTANALILCTVLYRLTGFLGRSVAVTLLFAIHPLHVESVAWIAERKDVLSTFFWLLTMWAYANYASKRSGLRYLAVIVLFTLGLLAKQMLVTLPLIFLLMDYWPLNRIALHHGEHDVNQLGIKALIVEKIPFLGLSAIASLIIVRAHTSAKALFDVNESTLLLHSGNAFISYVKYIRSMFLPVDLALFYPFEASAVSTVKVTGAVLLLATISGLVLIQGKRYRWLVFGWLWYLTTLLPVIGFIRVGGQALADRYTYIPLTGLFIILVWGVAEASGNWRKRLPVLAGLTILVAAILSALTVTQLRYWQTSYALYAHALAVVERNWLAHNNMGILLSQHNRNDEAIFHFQESVRLNPKGNEGYRNLGNSLQMAGKNFEAIEAYRQAVRLIPNDPESRYRLGLAYLLAGKSDFAVQEYSQLLRLDPSYAALLLDSIRILGKQ